ncbi:MAG: hypothetical protein WAV28_19200 [Sedimentisphaerales bacterium]|jgi:hypothetical protein
MRQKAKNSGNNANRLFNQLVVQKKKTVLALCLVTVMAFMWVRVLTKSKPQAAEAGLLAGQMGVETQSEPELKISFVELPQAAGRNDVITRDFFASDGWQDFVDGQGRKSVGVEEVDVISKGGDIEVIKKVAEKLKLEAIVSSENPLTFINDKVLRVGDKLLVGDGVDKYECEVVEIKENTVVMRCRESRITLKLTQVN